MQTRTVDHVESWNARPFSGGYRELHDLADDSFSGAVEAGGTWLFMLNGRVVGVFEGAIEDFADASGTVYEAPHLSLPLLFAMQERGGETRAKYYTEDTPLEETDRTLTDSNFVGYIELSENVLSGDYYTVYYGGRSMSAAFVGASEGLVTGEDAFERAADEVGVYEVVSVDVDIVDVPEPAEPATASKPEPEPKSESEAEDSTAVAAAGASESVDRATQREQDTETEVEAEADSGPDAADSDVGTEAAGADAEAETEEVDREPAAVTVEPEPGEAAEPAEEPGAAETGDAGAESEPTVPETPRAGAEPASEPEPAAEPEAEPAVDVERPSEGAAASTGETVFREEEAWRETTSVPAIDPEESGVPGDGAANGANDTEAATTERRSRRERGQQTPAPQSETEAEPARTRGQGQSTSRREQARQPTDTRTDERVEQLRAAVADRDERIEELEANLADAEQRLDARAEELERLREERDDLAARVDDLEDQLAEARASAATATGGASGEQRSPEEALSGTNLFVRYESKADPTLDALENGDATAEQINANLRLEHHTQFDASDVNVDGEPFERFLETSAPYRFVSWAVRELPYEILDTGHRNGLADLFEAIAQVDRAELDGVVSVRDEEGSEVSHAFDVVLRDRMGNPLVVADLNESRDPVSGEEMGELVGAAETVAGTSETLASAMYVTASFFEPGALEVADEETAGGGFLRGSDKDSFVKVSRKRGFHLCLIEDRNESFHVTVPEL